MILHLITDHQVVERMLDAFDEVFPKQNQTLIFTNKPNNLKHIKKHKDSAIVTTADLAQFSSMYDFGNVNAIIVHYLHWNMITLIKAAPISIPVVWEIYGADLYNQFIDHFGYEMYYENPVKYNKRFIFRNQIISGIYKRIRGVYKSPTLIKESFEYLTNRIDYLAGDEADFKVMEQYTNKKFKTLELFNYSIETAMADLMHRGFSTGHDILVGNSGSCSNNHLYTLECLKGIHSLENRNLILQMAYGAPSDLYRDKVIRLFKAKFGDNVKPILSYMPLVEYNRTYLNIENIILSNWRQEAVGTIYLGLFLGIKVFLSNRSPVYHWLKGLGYILFETESITQEDLDREMTEEEKNHNRELLIKQFNHPRLLEVIKQGFEQFI